MKLIPIAVVSCVSVVGSLCILALVADDELNSIAGPIGDSTQGHDQVKILEPVLASLKPFEIAHTFEFRNDTGVPLEFEKPVPGCGCASVSLDKQHCPVGETAKLAVTIRIPVGYEGDKSVSTSVRAKTGQSWRFQLGAPVVRQFVAPLRIALKAAEAGGAAGHNVRIQQRARSQAELSGVSLDFLAAISDLRISIVAQTDSRLVMSNTKFFSRNFDCRVEIEQPKELTSSIQWKLPGATMTTDVQVLAPEAAVAIHPRRLLLPPDSEKALVRVEVELPDNSYSATLLECPQFLSPRTRDPLTLASSAMEFDIDMVEEIRPVEEVVFQVFRNGKPHSQLKTTVIAMGLLRKKG